MAEFTKERIIEELKASTQNASGMFEIGEDTICALMFILTNEAPQLPQPAVTETLPCPVMLEPGFRFGKGVRTQTMLDALQRRAEYYAELEAMTPERRADHDAGLKEFAAVLQGAKSGERLGAEFEESLTDLIDAEMEPTCWCLTCRPVTMTDMRFVVCPKCGNKRCPHANDHRNACTGSNEPGQEGSAYPAAPHQEEPNRIHEERVKIQEEMAMGARLTKHRFKVK